jgi:hypothetical protein
MTSAQRTKILRKEYATFRSEVVKHFVTKVLPHARAVLDPMAGTSPLVPYIEYYGLSAHFNDILPIHFFINRAKTYSTYCKVSEAEETNPEKLRSDLCACMSKLEDKSLVISDQWIHDDVIEALLDAWEKTGGYEKEIQAFFQAVILLCVREYSCMSPSAKNTTWNRPGGITTEKSLHDVIQECMDRFMKYYHIHYAGKKEIRGGSLGFSMKDVCTLATDSKFDVILTSPSYPNRYDYVVAYAPETYFLSICEHTPTIEELRRQVMGTVVVKDYREHESDFQFIHQKSPKTGEFLATVREKQPAREGDYYFRFFCKYYSNLYRSLDRLIALLTSKGSFYIVLQNNIHRGELNDLVEFVADFFLNQGLHVSEENEWLRSHQGRRNISRNHPLVLKTHREVILRAKR